MNFTELIQRRLQETRRLFLAFLDLSGKLSKSHAICFNDQPLYSPDIETQIAQIFDARVTAHNRFDSLLTCILTCYTKACSKQLKAMPFFLKLDERSNTRAARELTYSKHSRFRASSFRVIAL
ncbi:hypothetical protein WN943_012414 [Citrus x changshan-huyou]